MSNQNAQLSKEIIDFENDSRWFYENAETFRKRKLTGKFVAISNKEVIASGDTFDLVVKQVENIGKNPAYILIEYIYPEGTIVLY
jgi:hypothetical protein